MSSTSLRVASAVLLALAQIALVNCDVCEDFYKMLVCPPKEGPSDLTRCCLRYDSDNHTVYDCCRETPRNEDSLVMMISLFVILLCLTLSICFVVCCFWSPCPLYSVCRMNYAYGDIVAYGKEEEALNSPPDVCRQTNYSPLHVKIKAVEED